MAYFVIYKRPQEITQYDMDFSNIANSADASLDQSKSKVTAFDTLDQDQSNAIIQKVTYSGFVQTAIIQGGLDGEDYLLYFDAVGNVSGLIANRTLEVRVRRKLSGAL